MAIAPRKVDDPNGWHEACDGEHVLVCNGSSVVAHQGSTVFIEGGARVHAYTGAWIHLIHPDAVCCFDGEIAIKGEGTVRSHEYNHLKECAPRRR